MEEWKKFHNVELHKLYSSPGIIKQIKLRRIKWTGHVARMGEEKNLQGFNVKTGRKERTRKTEA
jgi:hypothetical protein